jgi:hypothetical protein
MPPRPEPPGLRRHQHVLSRFGSLGVVQRAVTLDRSMRIARVITAGALTLIAIGCGSSPAGRVEAIGMTPPGEAPVAAPEADGVLAMAALPPTTAAQPLPAPQAIPTETIPRPPAPTLPTRTIPPAVPTDVSDLHAAAWRPPAEWTPTPTPLDVDWVTMCDARPLPVGFDAAEPMYTFRGAGGVVVQTRYSDDRPNWMDRFRACDQVGYAGHDPAGGGLVALSSFELPQSNTRRNIEGWRITGGLATVDFWLVPAGRGWAVLEVAFGPVSINDPNHSPLFTSMVVIDAMLNSARTATPAS